MRFKMFKHSPLMLSSLLCAISTVSVAQSSETKFDNTQIVVAPSCFFENSSVSFQELSKNGSFVLVKADRTNLELLREENAQKKCRFFKDVTPEWNEFLSQNTKKNSSQNLQVQAQRFLSLELTSSKQNASNLTLNTPSFEIKHANEVTSLLNAFVPENLENNLRTLTAFPNRYANSATGKQAAEWFKTQVEAIATATNRNDVTIQFIDTGFYSQPSVLVKIPGQDLSLDPVLVGGHFDTLSGVKPGADDDGSGAVTVLEILRTALTSGVSFKRTMYFAWYAAEEQGLVGSQYVTKYFVKNKIPLLAVLQLDMTGYQKKAENKIWMIDDYVDSSLSNFVAQLATTYAKVEVAHTKCGYACSDHASWSGKGYRSAMPFETKFGEDSPYIHTVNDTVDYISFEHMKRFAIIGISFLGELAVSQE